MNTITITDIKQLAEYADKLPKDIDWFKDNAFNFAENIQGIKIHITGERFHSSMSTTLMRSVLKLQQAVYRQYSIYTYGKVKKLSPKERDMLEIYAKVEDGSSWVELIPKPIIKAISKKVETMTNGQILSGIIIVSFAAVLCVSVPKIIDYKTRIKELEIQAETYKGIQHNAVQAQIETIKAQTEFYREITKQGGADSIEIDGENVDTEQVQVALSSPRKKAEKIQEVVEGYFKVTDIHLEENPIAIDVISDNGFVLKNVSLLEGLITKDDYKVIKDGVDKKFMSMKMVVTKKNDKIEGAFLDSFAE